MQFFGSRRKSNESDDITVEGEIVSEHDPFDTITHKQSVGFDTVLGPGSNVNGTLHTEGNIRLDGEFKGTLGIRGNVLVGENARIEADIEARNISIAGVVRGNVSGHRVQILTKGRVLGDISAHILTTEEGAFIDGKVSMTVPEPETTVDTESDSGETDMEVEPDSAQDDNGDEAETTVDATIKDETDDD